MLTSEHSGQPQKCERPKQFSVFSPIRFVPIHASVVQTRLRRQTRNQPLKHTLNAQTKHTIALLSILTLRKKRGRERERKNKKAYLLY